MAEVIIIPELKKCVVCHVDLELKEFYRFNAKNRVKRYFKVCNECIIKSRIRQNRLKNIDDEKKKYDDLLKNMLNNDIEEDE